MPGYRVPDDVAWIDKGEELYLTTVPDGTTVLLRDTARLIWLVAVTVATSLTRLRTSSTSPPSRSQHEVDAFVDDLIARGLLVAE